ncbi:hypothetical protein AB751O23_AA_00380 [Chlamydiales bacterium SCGC AB-751-O23]|nr:hypothetical protein AB751O23_AA_00380 [Chlamydiales bacterium SCGC AB-751-O23]
MLVLIPLTSASDEDFATLSDSFLMKGLSFYRIMGFL